MLDRERAQQCVNRLNAHLDAHRDALITTEELVIETWDDLYELCRHYESLVKALKSERDEKWARLLQGL